MPPETNKEYFQAKELKGYIFILLMLLFVWSVHFKLTINLCFAVFCPWGKVIKWLHSEYC